MQCFLQGEQQSSAQPHEASQPQEASAQPHEGSTAQPQLGAASQPHEASQPQLASQQCFAAKRAFRREKRQHFFAHGSQQLGSQPQLGSTQPQLGSAAQPQPPMPQA